MSPSPGSYSGLHQVTEMEVRAGGWYGQESNGGSTPARDEKIRAGHYYGTSIELRRPRSERGREK
jgi:hypothetical protein